MNRGLRGFHGWGIDCEVPAVSFGSLPSSAIIRVIRGPSLPRLTVVLILICLSFQASAGEPLRAFPVTEPPFSAQLAGIDRQGNLSFAVGDKIRVLASADLAYYGRYRDAERGPQIVLVGASLIRADVLLLDDQKLIIGDATGLNRGQWDESTLPREALAALIWQPPADAAARDRLLAALAEGRGIEDRLLLLGGESVAGTLTAAPRGGRFAADEEPAGSESFQLVRRGTPEPLTIPAAKVVAASFAVRQMPARQAGRMSAWLGLADGSLIHAAAIGLKGNAVTIDLAGGGTLHTTLAGRRDPDEKFWDEVTYIEPASPRVRWLSDQQPLGYKHIPFVSIERPFALDRCVLSSRLRSGGAVIRKGLGMPSASRLAYDVAGYRRFEAEIALDDAAGLAGSVIYKVLLETSAGQWQTAYESPIVRGGDGPLPISINLQGALRMALLIDFADRGDECDWANWLHARLSK